MKFFKGLFHSRLLNLAAVSLVFILFGVSSYATKTPIHIAEILEDAVFGNTDSRLLSALNKGLREGFLYNENYSVRADRMGISYQVTRFNKVELADDYEVSTKIIKNSDRANTSSIFYLHSMGLIHYGEVRAFVSFGKTKNPAPRKLDIISVTFLEHTKKNSKDSSIVLMKSVQNKVVDNVNAVLVERHAGFDDQLRVYSSFEKDRDTFAGHFNQLSFSIEFPVNSTLEDMSAALRLLLIELEKAYG